MRIVIAEDSVLLRDGLTRMLTDAGDEVVAAVPDADQLLRSVAEHKPDLAVIDVRMPPTHTDEGIRAALVIRRQYPDIALLVLSQYVVESYATDLLSAATRRTASRKSVTCATRSFSRYPTELVAADSRSVA